LIANNQFSLLLAPMSVETKKYFLSLDIPILEAFGMSESTGGHCMGTVHDPTFESIGRNAPGTQTRIDSPDEKGHGEICLRGRHVFMGYVGEMEKTMEAIDDEGWLHTGDIGYIDNDGYIFITGRIKEIIITAGGENIPPVHIENLVKAECSAISNAMLIGDKKKFLSMLLTLKTEVDGEGAPLDDLAPETLKWLETMDLKYTSLKEILAAGPCPKVMKSLEEAITRANKNSISNAQKVQKFAILPNDFSIPTGELGPTMKTKRSFIVDKYNDIVEKFYN
jgi:long-chain-fatty-acid--CoA ligase ACSBG